MGATHTDAPPATSAADDEDATLLGRAAAGDRDAAMGELYDRYARRLYGYGLRSLRDPGLAEELVQETFLRLWRAAARFDPARGTVSRYVFTIARNTAIDVHRRLPRLRQVGLGDPAMDGDAFESLITSLTVRDALGALTPDFRRVLELAYDEHLTQPQIADRLGVPVGTVKSRTHYALRALRTELTRRGIHA